MNKIFEKLQPFLDKGMAFTTATTLFSWDNETLAPEESQEYTAKVIGILSDEYYNSLVNDKVKKLLEKLEEEKEKDRLDEKEKAVFKHIKKTYDELESIPPEEYRDYCELTTKASKIWEKAKEKQSFKDFIPCLKKIVDYKKKFAGYRAKRREEPYDILLNDFEEGFKVEILDPFFEKIKKEIIPFIEKVNKKNSTIDKSYNHLEYDVEKQKEFCTWLCGYIGFDFNKGVIAESAHPFTTNLHNHDVRITNHYYKNNLESAIFSAIHEAGHGIYEMHIADELTQTLAGTGASMGMHESQSRFFENIIGKNKAFWVPVYPKLQEFFPEQLKNVSLDDFVKGINKSSPGLIRIESDELTYPLHIIIRYELEKMLINRKLKVEDLQKEWNKKYKEYLGVEPENDAEGVLQDVHWSGGDFGYFPSYVIGNAVAAQLYYHMKAAMLFEHYLEQGNITPVREFLNENIHKYGATKTTNEFLKDIMGEELNVDYYIKYLKEKYTEIYDL